jgi:hypothetical protein
MTTENRVVEITIDGESTGDQPIRSASGRMQPFDRLQTTQGFACDGES